MGFLVSTHFPFQVNEKVKYPENMEAGKSTEQ